MTLSVCMIVKNEEEYLGKCLDCVKEFADEIIVVDTGSTDKTIEIAKKYTDKIFFFEWIEDFSAARNFSFEKASGDYIMWVDADDIIDEKSIEVIKNLKKTITGEIHCVKMKYDVDFDENGIVVRSYMKTRIVKNNCSFKWRNTLHEVLEYTGKELVSNARITHTQKDKASSFDKYFIEIENKVNSDNPNLMDIYYYAGMLAYKGRFEEAKQNAEYFLSFNVTDTPIHAQACILLSRIYKNLNLHEKSIEILLNNQQYSLDSAEFFTEIGDHYRIHETLYETAIKYYKKALKASGGDGLIRDDKYYYFYPNLCLGDCYKNIGDRDTALAYYKKALTYDRQNEEARTKIDFFEKKDTEMASLSVCMIVKNEEHCIENSLKCAAQIADEIILVDTGSTDNTIEIAKKYTDKIYHFEWIDDFAAARNFSYEKATKDFIMWLDADDIILENDINIIIDLKYELDANIDCVVMRYVVERDQQGNIENAFKKQRITRRECGFLWHRSVHEELITRGRTIESAATITHNKIYTTASANRNFEIIKKNIDSDNADVLLMYYYAGTLALNGNMEEAQTAYEKYINSDSKNHMHHMFALKTLSEIYVSKGLIDKAKDLLSNSLTYVQDNSEFLCYCASFYKNTLQDIITAVKLYEKALKDKGTSNLLKIDAFYYLIPNRDLAECFVELEEYDKALAHYQAALGYDNKNEELQNMIYKLKKIIRLKSKNG